MHYALHTMLFTVRTSHYALHTTRYTLHITHYALPTTHYTLHTTHYTDPLQLAESPSAKAGLEDMRLLLNYCKLYDCQEVMV